jgi:hypothetical protein
MSEATNDTKTSFEKRLVFVICVILIDGFRLIRSFGVAKILNWGGLAFAVFLPVFARM